MMTTLYDFIDGQIITYTCDTPHDFFNKMLEIGGPSKRMDRFEYAHFLLSFVFLTTDGRFEVYEESYQEERGIARFNNYDEANQYFLHKVDSVIEECHQWQESCGFRRL